MPRVASNLASRAMGQDMSSAAAGDSNIAVKGAADAAQVSKPPISFRSHPSKGLITSIPSSIYVSQSVFNDEIKVKGLTCTPVVRLRMLLRHAASQVAMTSHFNTN